MSKYTKTHWVTISFKDPKTGTVSHQQTMDLDKTISAESVRQLIRAEYPQYSDHRLYIAVVLEEEPI